MELFRLILFGEAGVIVLLFLNLGEAYKLPAAQRPDLKSFYYWATYIAYSLLCGLIIYFLNDGIQLKDVLGLKPGNLTELYCFASIGLGISSIAKNIFKAL